MWLVHRGGCFSASPQESVYMCGLYRGGCFSAPPQEGAYMCGLYRGGCFSASPQEGAYMCGLYTEVAGLVLLPRRVRTCVACAQRWLL